jgi:hypothetical protein
LHICAGLRRAAPASEVRRAQAGALSKPLILFQNDARRGK